MVKRCMFFLNCVCISGKSLYIKRLCEKLQKQHSIQKPSVRKCIRLIEPKVDENVILQSLLNVPKGRELSVFHFDVMSSVICHCGVQFM